MIFSESPQLFLYSSHLGTHYWIQLKSCNSNSYNSKIHLNRRNSLIPWTVFYCVIQILIKKFIFPSCLEWCHGERIREDFMLEFSNSNVCKSFRCLIVLKINAWKKIASVLCSEWPQKESITKWLQKQSMKHWNSLRKIDLTKKLPFSSMFLEVPFLLGTNQSRPLSIE